MPALIPLKDVVDRGEPFSLPLGAMMLHVVDHAAYHRGQLNSMLKQAGALNA